MGKKSASKNRQPNAPEFQQILLESHIARQPPRNPYYPDIEAGSALLSPPPYSDLSTTTTNQANQFVPAMGHQSVPSSGANYARFSSQSGPSGTPAAVIVQQQPVYIDRKYENQNRKVRKFNNEMILAALFAIGLSIYCHHLYSERNCVNFVVHKPAKDLTITLYTVREMHLLVAYGSIVVLILSLAKCASGDSHSHSCYLFLMGLSTFAGTVFTGYLAYLAFYGTCSLKFSELLPNLAKTITAQFTNELPSPDQKVFGESSVFDLAREDPRGVWIFLMDLFNFTLYLSGFISAFVLC